ncbi:MAG: insulinase family protein, partial [Spirochaetia bacterium]|nr:insulinase family protein [Spirochaetia bacterium]
VFLWQKFMAQSFESVYRDPIIGYEPDLKAFTRQQMVDFYTRYYTPGNLIIVVSGDVVTADVLPMLKESFGTIAVPAASPAPARTPEPQAPPGIKYSAYSGAIEGRYLTIGFRIPDALSADIPKLQVLARALGGSESSPLYLSLREDKGLVDEIDADIFTGRFGGMFIISAEVRDGKYEETLNEIFTQLDRAGKEGIKTADVDRVKSDMMREEAREDMQVESAALNLGYYETLGDYNLYYDYADRLKRVLASDLQDVMRDYIVPGNASIAVYYPDQKEAEFKNVKTVDDIKKYVFAQAPVRESEEGVATLTKLPNGITLIHKKLSNTQIIDMKFLYRGGVVYESAQEGYYKGITNLMLQVMLKGTTTKNAKQVARELDDMGAVFTKDIRRDSFGWSAEVIAPKFGEFMELCADIMKNPAFEIPEIRKEKEDIINQIRQIKDSPAAYVSKIFNETFFEWHPYGYPVLGEEETVKRITLSVLKNWYKNYTLPNNLTVSVVGNIDADTVKEALVEQFGSQKPGRKMIPKLPLKITSEKKIKRVAIDKNQSHIMIGFIGPRPDSDDYFPYRVLDTILSGGMDSRLFSEVREKRNLCYTIYSTFDRNVENGAIRIYTATAPENENAAVDAIFDVLKDVVNTGVSQTEVASAKAYMSGMFKVGQQDYMSQAESYYSYELWGAGYKTVDRFLAEVDAVTLESVNEAAKKYLKLQNYTQVIAGPAEKKVKKSDKSKND